MTAREKLLKVFYRDRAIERNLVEWRQLLEFV